MADVFIAADGQGLNYFQPSLFKYGADLYQFIPSILPPTFPNPGPIQMWKSIDSGATWSLLPSTLLSQFPGTAAVCLLGTKLYVFYQTSSISSSAGLLAYFDFASGADTFTLVTTSGTVPQPDISFLAGPDANHLYLVNTQSFSGLFVGEFISNAYSSIGSLTSGLGANVITATAVLLGASGILHILYETSPTGFYADPTNLDYCNVQSGALVGTTGSTVVLSPLSDGWSVGNPGFPGTFSQPIQIGSNILLSYYNPATQKVMMLSFNDVAAPTFSTSVIDPSFAITGSPTTGAGTAMLAYLGSTLYCFYTNWSNTNNGDGWLYYRKSTDGGTTWSARLKVGQHLDPTDGTPISILTPTAMQFVGAPGSVNKIALTYRTNVANLEGQYKFGRFATILSPNQLIGRAHSSPAYGTAIAS